MSDEKFILFEEKKHIGIITLNRPAVLNALNMEMLQQLLKVLEDIQNIDSINAVIITGNGESAFSAGADIQFLNAADPLAVRNLARFAIKVYRRVETLGKPVIAAINGYALGGGLELAESCAVRFASSNALLGHPEVRIGAIAGWGGTTRLPRLIGKGKAAELLLTGKTVNGEEAYRIGLVNNIFAPENLMAASQEFAMEISRQSSIAVRLTWEAIHRGLNQTTEESAFLGADYFGLTASTEDFRTGTKAFIEKEKPVFKGK